MRAPPRVSSEGALARRVLSAWAMRILVPIALVAGCVQPAINEEVHHPSALREHRIGLAAAGGASIARADAGGGIDYFVTDVLSVGVSGRRYFEGDLAWSSTLAFGYSLLGVPLLPDLHLVAGTGVVGYEGKARIATQIGMGNRWFLTSFLALGAEVRDTLFVAPMTTASADMSRGGLESDFGLDLTLTLFLPITPIR